MLGARIGVSQPEYTIVGIASDAKYAHVRETTPAMWFVPHEQHPGVKYLDLYVRTAGDAASITDSVRAAIASVDPEVALFELRTLETQVDNLLIVERTVATLAAVFGATAAVLAGLGVYGILAFVVATRRREIAIRMALGAPPRAIVRQVTTETWAALAVGAIAGMAAAGGLTRYAGSLLYGVGPLDAVSFASGVVLVTLATTAAVALPSLRATRVNPIDALREA